jgi:hypothetical protein
MSHSFQEIRPNSIALWIDANSTLAEIQRFVGIMGAFRCDRCIGSLRFELTPKRALKARLFYHSDITVVRPLPHPRFTHPSTGARILRYSEAMALSKTLQGIPEGERLTTRSKFTGLFTKG